ncbi:MAG TPA: flagellar biosynthesis protein FlhB [Methylophilaceae bacterium]|jgi:flagellar biosynthetic protein FlhB
MAEQESDLERTEPASQRRLDEAREKGNIPRSRELNTFAITMAGAVSLLILGAGFADGLRALMQHWFTFNYRMLSDPMLMWHGFIDSVIAVLFLFIPFMVILVLAALMAPMSIGGWMFSSDALQPDFSRLNPLKGFARVFSLNGLAELVKAIFKALLVGGLGFWIIWGKREEILSLAAEPVSGGIPHALHIMAWSFVMITAAMLVIVLMDVPYQLWQYHHKLRMTKEEIRKEMRESEGDPHIKGRIRSLQREAARKRMMAEVPTADVIVTNPTHYAVALLYKPESMRAPKVLAKGSYLLAQRIRELGEENNVPILEAPSLARALYRHAEIEQEIPSALFAAVAEVLAYIYQLHSYNSGEGAQPLMPKDLPVPKELDFEPPEDAVFN